jgi:uncharacterized protein YbjT (DUF2867 family)
MKYVITGSLGNISRPVTKNLVAAGHEVTVISSNAGKQAEIEALGAQPAIGSVSDETFLKNTFREAEVAYLMIPSDFALQDYAKFQREVADHYLKALTGSAIKYVVLLSSIGAHLRQGAGPIDALGYLEEKLLAIPGLSLDFLRPSYFYSNLYSQIGLIRNAGIAGSNFGGTDEKLVLTHTDDIAAVATDHLLNLRPGHHITYMASDERHTSEIAALLGQAAGKENIPWITFSDDDAYQGMLGAGLNQSFATLYRDMGQALRNGTMQEDYWKNHPEKLGEYKFEDFVKEFAEAYKHG